VCVCEVGTGWWWWWWWKGSVEQAPGFCPLPQLLVASERVEFIARERDAFDGTRGAADLANRRRVGAVGRGREVRAPGEQRAASSRAHVFGNAGQGAGHA
jgi:hypothetical protein